MYVYVYMPLFILHPLIKTCKFMYSSLYACRYVCTTLNVLVCLFVCMYVKDDFDANLNFSFGRPWQTS